MFVWIGAWVFAQATGIDPNLIYGSTVGAISACIVGLMARGGVKGETAAIKVEINGLKTSQDTLERLLVAHMEGRNHER